MGIWIERQLEFVGSYRINLATTALVQLLACRHPALMALQVPKTPPPPPPLFRPLLQCSHLHLHTHCCHWFMDSQAAKLPLLLPLLRCACKPYSVEQYRAA